MTPIEVTYAVDPRLGMRGYRVCQRAAYRVSALLLGLGVLVLALTGDLVMLIASIAMLAVLELSGRRRLARHGKTTRQVGVAINDEGIRIEGQDSSTTCSWTAFTRVSRRSGFWMLRLRSGGSFMLPETSLDPRDTEAFTSLMQRRGLLPQAEVYAD